MSPSNYDIIGTLYHIILFLLGLVGKQKGHVHRLAMVIQALSNASEILLLAEQMQAGDIDSDFKERLRSALQTSMEKQTPL